MGKQPAVIIIARHGARLDQANKQWHLTSPTPYDPPLTYAGWIQARSLGARIAGIVRERENGNDLDILDESQNGNRKKRKRSHKIIIHSSPFLRCVQTSIGISAGIGRSEIRQAEKPENPSLSEPFQTIDSSPLKLATNTQERTGSIEKTKRGRVGLLPARLRVDAFLGEWLSPDYFENITPPPGSVLMIASAKADLLRAGEEIRGSDFTGHAVQTQWSHPWSNSGHSSPSESGERIGVRAMAAAGRSLPRNRTAFGGNITIGMPSSKLSPHLTTLQEDQPAYVWPVPMYAISSSDPIPGGYVAHARDACVEVEYQWDSMRPPQDWGSGGEYGEEWSTMHRRFRNGLQSMLAWYERNDAGEDDVDTVVVLVTHGAGCNAMIGAMTGQPVLLDIGLASLTMAVRKEGSKVPSLPSSPIRTRRGSLDLGIAERYDMEIIASTDHLRAAANPLGLNSQRLARSPAFTSRRAVGADSLEGFSIGDPLAWRSTSSTGLGRSASQKSHPADSGPRFSSGLWSSASEPSQDDAESSESDFLPAFERGFPTSEKPPELEIKHNQTENATARQMFVPTRTASQQGLWGSAPTMPQHDLTPKRRWTLVDNA